MVRFTSNAVDPGELLRLSDEELLGQCEVDTYRASGPGGQKRNKTSSAIRLRHRPTQLVAISNEDRSQHVNRRRALRRLRKTIALQLCTQVDVAKYTPGLAVVAAVTRSGQFRISQRHENYFAVICEILSVATVCGSSVRDTAMLIGITTSQLTEFLRRDPALWARFNELRREHGLDALR